MKDNWIKPGSTVIDVGINRMNAGGGKAKLVGEVDYAAAAGIAGHITCVPGGVGLWTISKLLKYVSRLVRRAVH